MMPDNRSLRGQAIAAYQRGALDEAERFCRAALAVDANDFEAGCLLAVIHGGQGRFDEALRGYTEALQRRPDHPGVLAGRGQTLLMLRQFEAALADFDRLVTLAPGHVDAMAGRGFALLCLRRFDAAAEMYAQALAIQPDRPELWSNRGSALHEAGRHTEALACFDRMLALDPGSTAAWSNRGNTLHAMARHEEALASFDQALALDPHYVAALLNRGVVQYRVARYQEALASFEAALALQPASATLLVHRGNCFRQLHRTSEALASYDAALAVDLDSADALSNRGAVLHALDRLEEALESCDKALRLRPDFAEALANRGAILYAQDRLDEALASLDATLGSDPNSAAAWSNRGLVLYQLRRFAEALDSYDRALALTPADAQPRINRAFTLLLLGRYREGWEAYEARREVGSWDPRAFSGPEWSGQDPGSKHILLYAEQGLGDVIQFSRFAVTLAEHGARVTLEVSRALAGLMRRLDGNVEIVLRGEPTPAFDLHCPLMSVPRLLRLTLADLPGKVPYLTADPGKAHVWRERLSGGGLKVGLVWAGNNRHRAMPLACVAPLLDVPGTRFYSLQVGPPAADLAASGFDRIVDLSAEQHDLTDAAAALANLDLLLSVDTSVAHLAGALGRPCWAILAFVPDWRWLIDRDDSPWYPTHRLFRQPATGDWDGVIASVRAALIEAAQTDC